MSDRESLEFWNENKTLYDGAVGQKSPILSECDSYTSQREGLG